MNLDEFLAQQQRERWEQQQREANAGALLEEQKSDFIRRSNAIFKNTAIEACNEIMDTLKRYRIPTYTGQRVEPIDYSRELHHVAFSILYLNNLIQVDIYADQAEMKYIMVFTRNLSLDKAIREFSQTDFTKEAINNALMDYLKDVVEI